MPKDILPKDILPNGHFADGHFVERTFCRPDSLTNGLFPKRQLAANREILGVVTRTAYDWLLNKTIVHFLSNECVALIRVLVK